MQGPEAPSGMQKVMRTAQQPHIPHLFAAQPGEGRHVVQFDECLSLAAPPSSGDKAAATDIPSVNLTPHRHRYMRPTLASPPGARAGLALRRLVTASDTETPPGGVRCSVDSTDCAFVLASVFVL